jgi:ribosomal protein S6--L-glutamate ligase
MNKRNVGLWLYSNDGGEQVEGKLIAGLRERGIECHRDLNLRFAEAHSGGIFCNDVRLDELDLYFSYNARQQSRYQVYLYELLDRQIPILNSFAGFSVAQDRMKTAIALRQGGIPCIDSFLCHRDDHDRILEGIGMWGSPAICKPIENGGLGNFLIEKQSDLDKILPLFNKLDLRFFYIEKLIDYDGTDFRVEVVDGEAIACYVRRNLDGDWCSNALSFGSPSVYGMNADLAALATRAANAVQLDIAAVDIIFDREQEDYVVLDIEAIPDFATPEQEALGLDFNAHKIAAIVDLIDRKTQEP